MARGIGQALDRFVLGVIDATQFDRVHAQRIGQLVHGRFQREQVRGLGRRAHEARGLAVQLHHVDLRQHIGTGVEPSRGGGAGDVVRRGSRRGLPAFMDQGLQPTVLRRPKPYMVAGLRPESDDGEALLARGFEPHGPVQAMGGNRDPGSAMGKTATRAEGAPDEAGNTAHIGRVGLDLLGQ